MGRRVLIIANSKRRLLSEATETKRKHFANIFITSAW